jgi:hypothetical protein
MGSLTPNASYTYEKENGVTFAVNEETGENIIAGWDYDPRTNDGRPLIEHIRDDKLWGEIRRAARTNPALRNALNQCIVIYNLSKDNGA